MDALLQNMLLESLKYLREETSVLVQVDVNTPRLETLERKLLHLHASEHLLLENGTTQEIKGPKVKFKETFKTFTDSFTIILKLRGKHCPQCILIYTFEVLMSGSDVSFGWLNTFESYGSDQVFQLWLPCYLTKKARPDPHF